MQFVPRPHQTRTLEAIRQAARQGHKRILVAAPTGSGKMATSGMLLSAAEAKGNPAIFMADQRELIGQCQRELRRMGVNAGTIMSGYDGDQMPDAPVQVVAKDTLWARAFRRYRMEKPEGAVICFDEAHRSMARTWKAIADAYPDAFLVGFTATPCRTDGKGLGSFYTKLIVGATYEELIAAGYLVPCRIVAPRTVDLSGVRVSKGDYVHGQLEERMDTRPLVGSILDDWKRWAGDRSTIVFASGVKHSIHICNEFRAIGVNAEHVDGNTPLDERADIFMRYENGDVRVLCNFGVVTTGVDLPIAKCGILARPTKSFVLFRQMCGRLMRPYPGYEDCLLIDHSAAYSAFGFPDEDVEWSLETTESVQERRQRAKNKPAKEPFACPKCHEVYRGPQCPKCGHRPVRMGKSTDMVDGDLFEVDRKRANRQASGDDKQQFWDDCLGWAVGTNKKVGAAAHRYRAKYGVWPNSSLKRVPRSQQWRMMAREYYREHVQREKA